MENLKFNKMFEDVEKNGANCSEESFDILVEYIKNTNKRLIAQEKFLKSHRFKRFDCCQFLSLNLKKDSHVYFILNEYNNMIKIGCSKNAHRRLGQLETNFTHLGMDNRLRIIGLIECSGLVMKRVEKELHDTFKDSRKRGEWFDITIEEIDLYLNNEFGDSYVKNGINHYKFDMSYFFMDDCFDILYKVFLEEDSVVIGELTSFILNTNSVFQEKFNKDTIFRRNFMARNLVEDNKVVCNRIKLLMDIPEYYRDVLPC